MKTLGVCLGILFAITYGAFSFISWSKGVDAYVAFAPFVFYGWGGLTIVIPILVGLAYRQITKPKELPFINALQYAFLAYVIYEVGYALVNVVISNFIDKGFNHAVNLASLHKEINQLANEGRPVDDFNKQLAFENAHPMGPFTFIQVILSLGQGIIWGFMKAMLVAMVIRKRPAQAAGQPRAEGPNGAPVGNLQNP